MAPPRVVEISDVFLHCCHQLGLAVPGPAIHKFFLQPAEKAFRNRIVPTLNLAAQATADASGSESLLVGAAGVRAPSVRMVNQPKAGFRDAMARLKTSRGRATSICSAIDHPMTRRENRSRMAAKKTHPSAVRRYVISVTHFWFGAVAEKSRLSRSGATGSPWRDWVVRINRLFLAPAVPFARIKRAMRCLPTMTPDATSS